MITFSKDQMHRPLFEEPTSDIERIDTWEGPFGFMIGGMANMSLRDLAEHYFDAALLLTETIRNGDREDYRLANPTLFLYRHSIELLLKSTMGVTAKTHSLNKLVDSFAALVKREFDTDVPAWIIARIKELAKIDPGSTAFRYSQNRDNATNKDMPVEGEIYVDLLHLQSTMKALNITLVEIIDKMNRRRCP